MPTRILCSAQP